MKTPGPDHPISIEPFDGTVSVSVGGVEIARSDRALAMQEAHYPAVYYVPREDVSMHVAQRSPKVTHCPHKGDAAHFSIAVADETVEDAAWSYETPFDAMAGIAGHLAFYTGKADVKAG
jgi:uncharacterized protein (DUF427 family)